jgi:hypothetical protein
VNPAVHVLPASSEEDSTSSEEDLTSSEEDPTSSEEDPTSSEGEVEDNDVRPRTPIPNETRTYGKLHYITFN